jgi:hypothetical protein
MEEKKLGSGEATVDDVIIKGATTAQLDAVEVTITLAGAQFEGISEGDPVTTWFTNMPAGLTAVAKEDASWTDTITITVNGTPTVESTQILVIIIPKEKISGATSNVTVDSNNKAKYFIAFGIKTLADFTTFKNAVNGGTVTKNAKLLSSSITVSGSNYVPVGNNKAHAYQGDFDGNNCTLNVNITGTTSFLALFGINNGTIHDLKVTGSVKLIEGPGSADADYIAVLVAYNDVLGKIIRCITQASVTAYTAGEPNIAHNIGGLAGFNGWDPFNTDSPHAGEDWEEGGIISQCRNEGAVTGGFNKIGGITGENAYIIEECVNTGVITCKKGAEVKGWPGVGGISGRNGNNNISQEQGSIINSYNRGTIVDGTATATEQNAYGGITGWCDIDSTVKNCYTTGAFSEATGSFRGSKNPIIGMVDQEPDGMTDNNYSLDSINASSTDEPLTGERKTDTYMKSQNFVGNLNKGSVFYKFNPDGYPKLIWE